MNSVDSVGSHFHRKRRTHEWKEATSVARFPLDPVGAVLQSQSPESNRLDLPRSCGPLVRLTCGPSCCSFLRLPSSPSRSLLLWAETGLLPSSSPAEGDDQRRAFCHPPRNAQRTRRLGLVPPGLHHVPSASAARTASGRPWPDLTDHHGGNTRRVAARVKAPLAPVEGSQVPSAVKVFPLFPSRRCATDALLGLARISDPTSITSVVGLNATTGRCCHTRRSQHRGGRRTFFGQHDWGTVLGCLDWRLGMETKGEAETYR